MLSEPAWGPTGRAVFERTYSRTKADGSKESWAETVRRVVEGNLALVPARYHEPGEAEALFELIHDFKAIPAGRHLWMTGVRGSQHLFNCHHAGWDAADPTAHFVFTFMQLMTGGGVGSNYSHVSIPVRRPVEVHLVLDADHADFVEVAPMLSSDFVVEWPGSTPIEDSREGWADALAQLIDAATGEGPDVPVELVFDLSHVRHRGAPIRTFGGTASGPAPLAAMLTEVARILGAVYREAAWTAVLDGLDAMAIDHAIATCVVSGNVRRSARMSIMDWDDPLVFDFIRLKRETLSHWSTNLSVGIDGRFLDGLEDDSDPRAVEVLHAVATGMLADGEPGLFNHELASVGELNPVRSTNPCGEIALEEWENCNLGHVNLDAFANDRAGAEEAFRLMARFLIRATFGDVPDPRQAEVLRRNRRIGVGFFGFQGWLVKQGIRFSDAPKWLSVANELRAFKRAARKAADAYAFELRIPAPIKVTTVAPTGTIAKLAGRSEGLHPIYARHFVRRIRYADDDPQLDVFRALGHNVVPDVYAPRTAVVELLTEDTLVHEVRELGLDPEELIEDASEVSLTSMLAVQALVQDCFADNAVSFTVNVPEGRYSLGHLTTALRAFLPFLKGTTLMPDGTRELAPYERLTFEEYLERSDLELVTVDDSYDEACASGACPVR